MFPYIDTHPNSYGTYHAQLSGDVNGSFRSRWSYVYDDDDFNYPFLFVLATNNYNYDVIIDFPLSSLGDNYFGDISWNFMSSYSVTNTLSYEATDMNYFDESNFKITLVLVDSRGDASPDPEFVDGTCIITLSDYNAHYKNSLREFLIDRIPLSDLEYVSLSRMVISTFDNSYSTYGYIKLQSWSNYRYSKALYDEWRFLQNGLDRVAVSNKVDGYDEGYSIGKDDGYQIGYDEAKDKYYTLGWQVGYEDGLSEDGIFGFIIESVEAFLSAELFPGFSFGLLLTSILGVCLLIWLLKVFAGG